MDCFRLRSLSYGGQVASHSDGAASPPPHKVQHNFLK